jgi:hypothetical protein
LDGGSTFVGEEEFLLIDSNSACSGWWDESNCGVSPLTNIPSSAWTEAWEMFDLADATEWLPFSGVFVAAMDWGDWRPWGMGLFSGSLNLSGDQFSIRMELVNFRRSGTCGCERCKMGAFSSSFQQGCYIRWREWWLHNGWLPEWLGRGSECCVHVMSKSTDISKSSLVC